MSGKILEFKRPDKDTPKEEPHVSILNNLTNLACALDEGAFFLNDMEGNEYDFLPVLGVTLLVDNDGNTIIQSNTQDHWVIREALELVLASLDSNREEEE